VFEYSSWEASSITKEQLIEMIYIGQYFCEQNISVYLCKISEWRKGYDFMLIKFEPNNIDKILIHIDGDGDGIKSEKLYIKPIEKFRIYIDRE
jgi:hypothetical protein